MLRITAVLACMLLFCSCGAVSMTGTENLLVAPKMNKRQEQVSKALESTLSLDDIVYKYPQSGDYRSPFVFFDLTGNGSEEAIVFYSYSGRDDDNARAKILKQDLNGEWTPFYDITLQSSQLDFIEFHKLLSADSYCMLVSMQSSSRSPSTLAVYSINESSVPLETEQQYYSYSVRDFNGDGLSEIAVITRERSDNSFYISLLQKQGSHIAQGAKIALSSEVGSIEKLSYGRLWDGGGALYIDETLADDGPVPTTATEVIRADKSGLHLLAGGEVRQSSDNYSEARTNYEFTFRDEAIYCMDFDQNGTVEVPDLVSLPGEYSELPMQNPKLIQLMNLNEEGFSFESSAVINTDAGYMMYFPDKWLDDAVTVESRAENSEWHFRKWNSETQEASEELLRIRTAAISDNPELFDNYTELSRKGMTVYWAYIPRLQNEGLAVTEQELRSLFKLLP